MVAAARRQRGDGVPPFGVLLRSHRLAARLTQERLAERAGLSARTVGDLERGRVRAPRSPSLILLADALGLAGTDREVFERAGREAYWGSRSAASRPDSDAATVEVGSPGGPSAVARPKRAGRGRRKDTIAGARSICLLPPDVADYTGYEGEVAAVVRCLTCTGDPPGRDRTALPVVVISGPGGAGKTALAVHVAHLLRGHYPDGQLFVGLGDGGRGPELALARLQRSLGIPAASAPARVEEEVDRYRLALAGRRVLAVFDDAAGVEQVRPLLPGEPGCAVIVTSRTGMPGLEGAATVELTVLPEREALSLLRRIIGTGRLDRDPAAARQLVELCGGLPLAIRIAGGRLAARPHWPPRRLVERMTDERHRLDELVAGDLAVRACVGVSYRALDPAAARAFRLLSLLDTADFAAWMAAAMLDLSVAAAEDLLDRLVGARLVEAASDASDTSAGGDRYRMHALVRLYARERAESEDGQRERRDAISRAVRAAVELTEPMIEHLPSAIDTARHPRTANSTVRAGRTASQEEARTWLTAEEGALVATVEQAAGLGLDELAGRLANALVFASFGIRNRFDGWTRAHTAVRAATRTAGNRVGEARTECGLGQLSYEQDRFAESRDHFEAARQLSCSCHDHAGEAVALNGLGTALHELGEHRGALPLLERARDILQRIDDDIGVAYALLVLGGIHREFGDDEAAIQHLTDAVTRYRRADHRRGEALAVRGVSLVHRARGSLDAAEELAARAHQIAITLHDELLLCYTAQATAKTLIRQGKTQAAGPLLHTALGTCRHLHDRFGTALIHRTLGELHLATGNPGHSLRYLRNAQTGWEQIHHRLGRARTLRDIGAAHSLRGNCPAAHHAWRDALATFTGIGTREAAELPTWQQQWNCHCPSRDLYTDATGY
jgi:tetratricopeptide (TPR) repeat protein/transcriptional regulator with XRE-family HTH domain